MNIFNSICTVFFIFPTIVSFIDKTLFSVTCTICKKTIDALSILEYNVKRVWNSSTIIGLRNDYFYLTRSYDIEIIKYNEPLSSIPVSEIENYSDELIHDFFIYSDYSTFSRSKINKVNKLVYFSIPKIFTYELCKFTFLSITISQGERVYYIRLKSDTENYYIVGNKLNKLFIGYLLKKQCNVDIAEKYTLEILDQHIISKKLDETDEIIFVEENNYKIYKQNIY